jgi:hypothetical protein
MKAFKTIWVFAFLLHAPGLFAQNQQAVLVKGNEWQTGIPGFGSNTFPALFGEYLTQAADAVSAAPREYQSRQFMVRVSGQALLFNPALWQPRPNLNSAVQRQDGDSFLIAFPFSIPGGAGSLTIIFQFPRGLGDSGDESLFGEAEADRLIRAWTGRFGYFLSLVKNFADISLPAVVGF